MNQKFVRASAPADTEHPDLWGDKPPKPELPAEVVAAIEALDRIQQKPPEVAELLARKSAERWAAWEAQKAAAPPPQPLDALVSAVDAIPSVCRDAKKAILRVLTEFHKVCTGAAPLALELPEASSRPPLLPLGSFVASETCIAFVIRRSSGGVRVQSSRGAYVEITPAVLPDYFQGARPASPQEVAECIAKWSARQAREALLWCDSPVLRPAAMLEPEEAAAGELAEFTEAGDN